MQLGILGGPLVFVSVAVFSCCCGVANCCVRASPTRRVWDFNVFLEKHGSGHTRDEVWHEKSSRVGGHSSSDEHCQSHIDAQGLMIQKCFVVTTYVLENFSSLGCMIV
jgi:hypothetical protein